MGRYSSTILDEAINRCDGSDVSSDRFSPWKGDSLVLGIGDGTQTWYSACGIEKKRKKYSKVQK
jgi:hypothetical protein